MNKSVTLLTTLLLAGAGGTVMVDTLATSPAFNLELRQQNVYGLDVLQYSAPMYEESAYLFQIGMSYLRADLVTSAATGSASDYAPSEVALERAEAAAVLFERSLALAPSNAHVWTSLAWARTLTGDVDGARAAVNRSWDLAPHNPQLAARRLSLAEALFAWDIPRLQILPNDQEIMALSRDLKVLEQSDPSTYKFYAQRLPEALTIQS